MSTVVAHLIWNDAKYSDPDPDVVVLVWNGDDWFVAAYEFQSGSYIGQMDEGVIDGVTHWADPEGPR